MKLRLTAKGWETYNGQMGVIFFENGLSVSDVLPVDAVRVAGVIGAEWEDGSPANMSQIYLDNMHTEALTPEEQRQSDSADAPKTVDSDIAKEKAAELGVTYTEEQLAAIADKDGISGLREIAHPLGIKGNSIRGLIQSILKAAATPKAE
jgi:hypothetical protein